MDPLRVETGSMRALVRIFSMNFWPVISGSDAGPAMPSRRIASCLRCAATREGERQRLAGLDDLQTFGCLEANRASGAAGKTSGHDFSVFKLKNVSLRVQRRRHGGKQSEEPGVFFMVDERLYFSCFVSLLLAVDTGLAAGEKGGSCLVWCAQRTLAGGTFHNQRFPFSFITIFRAAFSAVVGISRFNCGRDSSFTCPDGRGHFQRRTGAADGAGDLTGSGNHSTERNRNAKRIPMPSHSQNASCQTMVGRRALAADTAHS